MAQQPLDRPDVDAGFAQVSRETMAPRMDAMAMRDPRSPLGMIGDVLRGADGHRPVGIASRQEPRGWPVQVPVGAQCGQQARGEQGVAILPPFPLLDADESTITFNIGELQPDDFADAQASGIGGHQEDAVPGILGPRAQALEFRDAQHLWEL
jgi:hypothetical protein